MSKNGQDGFVAIFVLAIAVIAIVGTLFFVSYKNVAPEIAVVNDNAQLASTASLPIVINVASTTQATTTVGLVVKTDDELASSSSAKIAGPNLIKKSPLSSANSEGSSGTKTDKKVLATTTEKIVEINKISEPTLFVEEGKEPSSTLLIGNARRVPFTVVELTAKGGDITVDDVVIERRGQASDRVFVEVGLVDIGNEQGLNSEHKYHNRSQFTIKDGEPQEIVLYGNIVDRDTLASYEGQTPTLVLTEIKTKAKLSGTALPIIGTMHKVNSSLVLGSFATSNSGLDPGAERNLYVNSLDVIFSAVRIDATGVEPMLLKSWSWFQTGSVSRLDISNVQTCVVYKGGKHCFVAEPDSDGKYYSSDFNDEVKIDKGESAEIYIKGDVLTTGSNRTLEFDLSSSYDVIAYGLNFKNFIYSDGEGDDGPQPEGTFSASEFPFYHGYQHTIVPGNLNSISR